MKYKPNTTLHKAIFLDRDGVINKERGEYTWKIEDFILNKDIFTALSVLQKNGFLLIIITNQGGIAKGFYNIKDVDKVHSFMINQFKDQNIEIAEIFLCPHHPNYTRCICRKPDSLMLERAISKYNIDRSKSYFIGDKKRDTESAEKAKIKGILIQANESLLPIVDEILNNEIL